MILSARIFSYKDYIGAVSYLDTGEFINDIDGPSQMGVVVDVSNVEITEEARSLIKETFKRVGGSFANVMLTDYGDSKSIAMLGFGTHLLGIPISPIELSRDCDLSVLDSIPANNDMEIPKEFKNMVDNADIT